MTEAEIRAAHPDWTDEQVAAEVAKQKTDPPAAPPAPTTGDNEAFARIRREAEDAKKRAKAAEDKLAEAERKKAEEEGRFKDLADKEKARADKLEADQKAKDAQRNAERTATHLKFKDPGYALYLLNQDGIDLADAPAVKKALEEIAKDRAELLTGSAPPPSGGPAGGNKGDPPKVTREDLKKMSAQQIQALDPKVVAEALAA